MTYAPADRAIYDADSHIMELPDFLKKYADPSLRDEIPEVSYSASLGRFASDGRKCIQRHSPATPRLQRIKKIQKTVAITAAGTPGALASGMPDLRQSDRGWAAREESDTLKTSLTASVSSRVRFRRRSLSRKSQVQTLSDKDNFK